MRAFNVVLFIICLNVGGLVVANLMAQNVLTSGEVNEMPYSLDDIQGMFNPFRFSVSNVLYGLIGAGIVGLLGLITRNGTFAIYAVILFLVGMFINVIQWVLFGLPKLLEFMLAGTGLEWMSFVVAAFMYFVFFWFLAELLAQRQLMT